MILADPRNPTAAQFEAELRRRVPDLADDPSLTVVIGGDGHMLSCVRTHGADTTYLGLNAGRIGFLMNDVRDWDDTAAKLAARSYTAHRFPRLHATLQAEDGSRLDDLAVNDIYLERATGQTAHLTLSIDGQPMVETLVADGLIFSTALGSTAYTFSAGGPACHPTLQVLAVTAICPHHPRLSPFLLPATSQATVTVKDAHRRPVRAVVDGHGIARVHSLRVRQSRRGVRFAFLDGHAFTGAMVEKILRP